MAAEKVNINSIVDTQSFGKDNYARRVLKKAASAIDAHAENIDSILNILSPMKLIGTYTSAVDATFPTAGIGWTDFTAVTGGTLTGARGIAFLIEGITVGTATFGNKNVSINILDSESHVIMQANDRNSQVEFEYFKLTTAISGEIYAEFSGRAPSSTTASQREGFSKKIVGLDDGVIIPASPISIGDFNISFGTNRLTQNNDITIKAYAQF